MKKRYLQQNPRLKRLPLTMHLQSRNSSRCNFDGNSIASASEGKAFRYASQKYLPKTGDRSHSGGERVVPGENSVLIDSIDLAGLTLGKRTSIYCLIFKKSSRPPAHLGRTLMSRD